MKKFFAVIVLATAVAVSAFAQPKAIGGRFGYSGLEASYQHYLGNPNFLELDLGADFGYGNAWGFQASALYNITFAQPNWTSRGDWAWYAGLGLSTGYVYDRGGNKVEVAGNKAYERQGMGFMVSVPVQVGLSYTFWFPLQLSVDIRPYLGIQNVSNRSKTENTTVKTSHTGFYMRGLYGFAPSLSVHYAF